MKSSTKWGIGIGVFAVLAFIVLIASGVIVFQSALSSTFTPVYCNDPTSVCCVKTSTTVGVALAPDRYSDNCKLTDVSCSADKQSGYYLYYGSQNCRIVKDISTLWISQYKCDDMHSVAFSTVAPVAIPKGFFVWTDRAATVSLTNIGQKLVTNLGVPVSGDNCVFTAASGTKVTDSAGNDLGASYTVPAGSGVGTLDSCVLTWNAGNRHICGNLEEQCSADSDCVGHTYGSKECYQRTLQTYGCRRLAVPSGVSDLWDNGGLYAPLGSQNKPANTYNGVTARCEIKSATPVQCCGDTDCGASLVCDTTTFTCKQPAQVECSQNSDCGVSVQCDYSSKQLKTPICSSGKCAYSTKSVGCCSDANCANGEYCTSEHKCALKTVVKVACPFDCCQDDAGYFDKACLANHFCNNHVCSTVPECTKDSDCGANRQCKNNVCEAINPQTCENLLGGLVISEFGVKQECSFWCQIGLAKPAPINTCVHDYTPLIIAIVALLVILIIFMRSRKGGKKPSNTPKKEWYKETGTWIALAIGAGVLIFIFYFKYVFWLTIVLIILAVLIFIFRRKVIKPIMAIFG